MHDRDRAAALTAVRQQLSRIEGLGMEKSAALSVREYLGELHSAGIIDAEIACAAADLYERCRYGRRGVERGEAERIVASLETAAARLETMDQADRLALAASLPRCQSREAKLTAATGSLPAAQTFPSRRAPRQIEATSQESARLRKRRAERGPSRVWTFIACGVVLWTLAVMAGSLWQHDRIERMLGSSQWGRPLISRLRGEQEEQSRLRRKIEADKRSATAQEFYHLAQTHLLRRDYAQAIHAYQQGAARAADAQKASMLNDLAWMLLTADDPWYRDSIQAEQLARQAFDLSDAPEICDTLAVACFENGRIGEAIQMESLALENARDSPELFGDRRYYQQQLLRFERAEKEVESAAPASFFAQ